MYQLPPRSDVCDRAAFDELVVRCRDRLRVVIENRLGPEVREQLEPEDVFQETCLCAFQSLAGFTWRGEDSFCRWLFGIAEHVILKYAKRARHAPKQRLKCDQIAPEVSPSRTLRRNERFERLQEMFKRLSPEQREVIRLARFEGCGLKDIAARLNKSPAAVGQTLSRALRKLRALLGETESYHLSDRRLYGPDEELGRGEDE